MIKNENDFLGVLIANSNDNNDCSMNEILCSGEISSIDASHYISKLEEKGYIKLTDLDTVHIFPNAQKAYNGCFKKIKTGIFSMLHFSGNTFLQIFVTVISALIVAFIVWKLGWQ